MPPMANQLLHCFICPKKPDFSDASHLLTHVSSKGHLSHLHKLQVRSHQERAASQQLAIYNQWFLEHNVAHMLSERMQQKEIKQAKKRADNKRRCATAKRDSQIVVDPNLLPDDGQSKAESDEYPSSNVTTSNSSSSSYVDEAAYTHLQQISPYSEPHAAADLPWAIEASISRETLSSPLELIEDMTPEMARLKGIIWPGMDMFDSADAETQRKRNQRKDISVLKRMQAMSELVEPMETVCSPGGTVKKRRHVDDLEDDSPVEGESPFMKQSSKCKRKPLSILSHNASGQMLRKPRSSRIMSNTLTTPTRVMRASGKPQRNHRHYRPSRRTTTSYKRSHDLAEATQRRQTNFEIFDEESMASTDGQPVKMLANPFLGAGLEPIETPERSIAATWLQPRHLIEQAYDPFRACRPSHLLSDTFAAFNEDKENSNPLTWHKDLKTIATSPIAASHAEFDNFDDGFGALAEVYAFTQNPLFNPASSSNAFDFGPLSARKRHPTSVSKPHFYR